MFQVGLKGCTVTALLGSGESTQERAAMNGPTAGKASIKIYSKARTNARKSAFSGLVLLYIRHSGNIPFPIFPGERSRDISIAGLQAPDPD